MKVKKLLILFAAITALTMSGCSTIEKIDDSSDFNQSSSETQYFHVTFNNYDSSLLYSTLVEAGMTAKYSGPTPTRPNEGTYKYSFIGWDKPVESTRINEDTIFTAQYTVSYVSVYNVTFVNYDGTLLYSTQVYEGEDAIYRGDIPTRPDSLNGTSYTFVGWNKPTTNIQEDTTFTAVYSSKEAQYTVRFFDYDEITILDIQYATYGNGVNYQGPLPTRKDEEAITYTFSGWDKDTSYITGDLDVYALYSESVRSVKVTYVNFDGSLLYEDVVDYGSASYYPYSDPTRDPEGRIEYVFSGWNTSTDAVYTDLIVVAQYTKQDRRASSGLSFGYDSTNEVYYVSGYSGSESDIFIPKEYEGSYGKHKVAAIYDYAISYNSNIKTIFIEDNVTYISSYAFYSLSNLTSIRFSDRLKTINDYFVSSCDKLKSVDLPMTVNSISRNAFNSLSSSCEINIDERNPFYKYEDGILYNADMTTIYFGISNRTPNNLVILEGVKTISSEAFKYNSSILYVVLPSSIESIGSYAFYNCSNLISLEINNAACDINEYAFSDCYNMTSVDLGDSVKQLLSYSFSNIPITSISIPASTTFISDYAFEYCNNLTTISVHNDNPNYTMMDYVLVNKDYTNIIIIPNGNNGVLHVSSEYTGSIDFYKINNRSIPFVEIESGNTFYESNSKLCYSKSGESIYYCNRSTTSVSTNDFPSNAQYIESYSFASTFDLTTITLPNSITSIRYYAFGNSSITSITIPNNVSNLDSDIFNSCNSLTTATVGSGVTSIPYGMFHYCRNLNSVSLPSSLTSIGGYAFSYCSSLLSINLPSNITSIDYEAFEECSSLTTVSLPSKLTYLSWNAFQSCTSLTSITIPNKVTSMDSSVFNNCTSLSSVTIGTGLTYIQSSTFYNCTSLKEIEIPSNITSIGDSAFAYCTALTGIAIPDSVTSLSDNVFNNCSSLKSVELGNGITTIPSSAFYYCSSLKKIIIPEGVTLINSSAFRYCSSLTTVVLPKTLTYIYDYAFYNCGVLNCIYYLGSSTDWNNIYIYDSFSKSTPVYYYSETEPTESNVYWHYVDGEPTVWVLDED